MTKVAAKVILHPDSGPLITLAYANHLDLLLKPEWPVCVVDMVLHELTRNETPTSEKIKSWVESRNIPVLETGIFKDYRKLLVKDKTGETPPRKNNLGEFAIQEVMNRFALAKPPSAGVFLFEDHKIARTGFVLPHNCRKVSTRSFLLFLQENNWITSAAAIEAKAIQAGRKFSGMRFPPD